ncbi:V-type ATP synthase subunit I domain-containing protein [Ulvibacter antarcticus]|uniref:Colicin import membrane protein n=1 Tax=Ulvibacter antarcticus TaxID=442714 RepID=A0A3L9YD19_9FLAO|nr:hypothetical protein [Ulvibacter antarcticus]RMA58623.1 hypothetical protein BXY75_1997 [Ulvibacter antarcticus]
MKNIKKNVYALFVLLMMGSFVVNSQNDADRKTQDTREVLTNKTKVKKEQTKEELKEIEAAAKQQKSDAKHQVSGIENEIDHLKMKIKNTTDPKEKAALENEIKQMQAGKKNVKSTVKEAIKDQKNNAGHEVIEASEDKRKELKENASSETAKIKKNANDKVKKEVPADLKWQEYRVEKTADAKELIKVKKEELSDRGAYIERSKTQIAAAKKGLQARIDAGSITPEQVSMYKTRIANAEKRLNDYENNVEDSKKKLDVYSNQVSDMDVKN